MLVDTLRPPPPFDPAAPAYKDWLHLNVFDHATGAVGVFNASLHGAPGDPRARAVGTALVHLPDAGWVGNVEVLPMGEASVGATSVGLERVAVATDPAAGTVLVSARLPADGLEVGVTARAEARPFDVALHYPFGAGWIGWYAVPRLTVRGGMSVGGRRIDLSGAAAYHDHNWGRWHWGDDVGWEWGACAAADGAVTLVVSRATDRAHARCSGATLVADVGGARRAFSGAAVRVTYEGRLDPPARRLPGALAALRQDRRAPHLPARVRVRADDGVDAVDATFHPRAAAQLIAADPARPGQGFLHELVGAFSATCRVAGRRVEAEGLAVFEHVD